MEKELTSKVIVPTFRVEEMLSETMIDNARIKSDWVHYIAPSVYNKVYYLVCIIRCTILFIKVCCANLK